MTDGSAAADIGAAWIAAVAELGGDAGHGVERAADLVRRYQEPHRGYHGLDHIVAVLHDSRRLANELTLDPSERALLTLAVCAHDVVYDGDPGADERASAAWARDALVGVPLAAVDRVGALILATIEHIAPAGDVLAAVLLDADLAILAAAAEAYARYVTAVRSEYAHLPDERWRVGRATVLRGLLEHTTLYVTPAARQRWEAPARANVAGELASLTLTQRR